MKTEFIGSRRSFIKMAAILGGVVALLGTDRPATAKPKPPLPQPEESGRGYRLTEQVKKYYQAARF
jgi:hypothetical protein